MRRILLLFWVTGAVSVSSTPPAYAGVWFQTSVSASQTTDDQFGATVADIRLFNSATLGFSFLQGFVVGAQGLFDRTGSSGTYTWAIGPKGGLLIKGFELTGAFLPWINSWDAFSSRTGSGFAINVGYNFKVVGPIRLGLYGTYWSSTFTQRNGLPLITAQHTSELAPQLSLALDF